MSDRRDDSDGAPLTPEEWVRLQFEALQEDVADEQRARSAQSAASPAEADAPVAQPQTEPSQPPAAPGTPAPTDAATTAATPAPSNATQPVESTSPPPARRRAAEPVAPLDGPAADRGPALEPSIDFGLPPTALPPQAFGASSAPGATPAVPSEPSAAPPAQPEPSAAPPTQPEPSAEPSAAEPTTPAAADLQQPTPASARPDLDDGWGEPTQAMAAVPSGGDRTDDGWGEPTQAMTLPQRDGGDDRGEPTQAMPVPPTAVGPSTEETGLDDLFGVDRFREVDDGVAGEAPLRSRERRPAEREPMPRNVRILAWVAGGLVALLALLGLFWLGVQSPWSAAAPAPSPSATSTASATPPPTPEPVEEPIVGPVAPGAYAWDELGGGECLDPFPGPWEEEYTVVDCAQPHAAQLVSLTELGQTSDPYPGLEALAGETNVRCGAAVSLEAASAYDDVVVEGSYAATEQAWQDGENDYACFARRSGGEAIEGSLAR